MNKNLLVGFWSPYHGQTCTTSSLVAVGTYIGITQNIKTLLMHSKFDKSNLENAFLSKHEDIEVLFDETGIDSLQRLAKTNQLTSENFTDYTKTLIKNRLDLLVGTNKASREIYAKILDTLQYILVCAKKCYDLVLCDVNAGIQDEITNKILECVDLIVICLNQNVQVLEAFFTKKEWLPVLDKKKYTILLGNYDRSSKYSARYIKRLFDYSGKIYTIPRNTDFMDAYNDHGVIQYFFANHDTSNKDSDNYFFICEVRNISKWIIQHINIQSDLLEKPVESFSFPKIISKIFTTKWVSR